PRRSGASACRSASPAAASAKAARSRSSARARRPTASQSAPGPLELAPGLGKCGPRRRPPSPLALDEPARGERRTRTGRLREELAQPCLGHDRVLVLAEHVLERSGPLRHALRPLPEVRLGELGRVPCALAEDSRP